MSEYNHQEFVRRCLGLLFLLRFTRALSSFGMDCFPIVRDWVCSRWGRGGWASSSA